MRQPAETTENRNNRKLDVQTTVWEVRGVGTGGCDLVRNKGTDKIIRNK